LDERVRFGSTTEAVATYNIPLVYEITQAPISLERLKRALTTLIQKHKVLRTRLIFDEKEGVLQQEIVDLVPLEITLTTVGSERDLHDILYDEETNPALFKLNEGLVFHCSAIRRSVDTDADLLGLSDILIFNFHHAAFDGTSIDIFFRDLEKAYSTGQSLAPDVFDYIDYSMHEKEMNMDEARVYWKQHLNGFANTLLHLPYDRFPKNRNMRSGRGLTVSFGLSQDLVEKMLSFMTEWEMTVFQVGLGAFYVFLFKVTQQIDLCVLTISANRHRAELEHIIGFFSNTLPQRVIIDPSLTLTVFFSYIKEVCHVSMRHAHFPYQEMGESPGIQTLFLGELVRQPSDGTDFQLIPLATTHDDYVAKFDLTCSLDYNFQSRSITVSLNASSDLFNIETVSIMAHRFEYLLSQIFTSIPSSVCELSILLPHEIELLRVVNTDNKFEHQAHILSVHEQFACRADEHPQKLAVILDNQSLTYAELFYFAQIVAHHLINLCLVRPNDIVPLCVERSLEMPVGILTTLMSGAIYCPLTPNHPRQRLQAIIHQTNARCILTHDATANKFESSSVNLSSFSLFNGIDTIEQPFKAPICSVDQVAYIIFTSGSTGEPKGVQLTHRNLVLTVASYAHTGSLLPTDTTMQITPCSFDAHVPELLGCLFMGGTSILLHPDGNIQLDYLTRLIERHQASYMHSVPSHLTVICEQLEKDNVFERLLTLRSLCSSGEPMDVRSLRKFRQNTRATIFNLYGPAECTDVSIYKITQDIKQVIEPVCIGQLSPNLICRILDQYMQTILPDGHQIGELFVSGPSVFPGYLNRDDLTRRVLINGLTETGEQYYKTGDLVRLDSRCTLHYVGRRDFMVKLRGQRIELAEIEQTLYDASPDIGKCVVIKHENSSTSHEYLVAFVQTTDMHIEPMLQQKCQERLPSYMVPSLFVLLDKLPLSDNGKVDRARLPNPNIIITQSGNQSGEKAKTETERRISIIWCEILRLDAIPSTSFSFFKLGGNSLLLMKLYYSYQRMVQFNTNSLLISEFFRRATIVDHAKLLEAHQITEELQWQSFHITKGKSSSN
jgi:amino acid adenylation domain-containing protein